MIPGKMESIGLGFIVMSISSTVFETQILPKLYYIVNISYSHNQYC